MSTQLILYPQSYKGRFSSSSSAVFSEYIVNGMFFIGLNGTTLYNTNDPHPSRDAVSSSPPTTLGNWYRYTTTGTPWASITAPAVTSGNLVLSYNALGGTGHTGVYQRLSGLIVGAQYDAVITIDTTSADGILTFEMYTGTVLNSPSPSFVTNVSIITRTFTAQSTNDIFLIDYAVYGASGELIIRSISITESATSPTLIYSDLEDGQVICDLYQEEDIPLSLSVDDFKNVAEQVKSYSKDFNLPATKRNNQIFNNMFEITRADDGLIFNPYAKTQCILKEDGFILFEGYLKLIDVKDKDGEISYNVNLYSEVIALADTLKDRTFSNLDFSELEHKYNYSEIRESWQGTLTVDPLPISSFANNTGVAGATTTNVLKYPFIDWNHQFVVGDAGTGTAATPGFPELTSLEQAFRPCIQLKYLINKIFAASGFNWTSNFFDSADFGKLYMDFNWGSALAPNTNMGAGVGENMDISGNSAALTSSRLEFDLENFSSASELGYDNTTSKFTANRDNQVYFVDSHFVFDYTGATGSYGTIGLCGWEKFDALGVSTGYFAGAGYLGNIGNAGSVLYHKIFTITLDTGESIRPSFRKDYAAVTIIQEPTNAMAYPPFQNHSIVITGTEDITSEVLLENLRGELGQWDFLKGIMTMFNLVSMVDETDPNNILIEPYSDIFIDNPDSKRLDWTEKIDASQMESKPLTDLNKKTIFKFVEDEDDYIFRQYKNSTSGHLYGSKEIDASTSTNGMPTVLEGTKEIIAEPFAATVSKPLMSQFPDFIVPSVYAHNDDGTSEGFDNAPRIFYTNGVKTLTSCTYYVPVQNGGTAFNEPEFLQFSHFTTIPSVSLTTTDFVFESQQLLPAVGTPPTDNLFSTYWQPYFNELYNADTRTMTLKVNLTPADINTFKFYDTVFIKNRSFRVNKIEYKPNELAKVEFILIP